ncbi:MAG: DctP family TRAP transporter solute-binding subunit [Xanthomonadales bacterium]
MLLATLISTGCEREARDREIILIKFPHVTAPITPKGQAAEYFRQAVEKRLSGRVKVEVFPSSQLMNDDDSLEALAFGEVEMIAISLSKLNRLTHRFQVFDLPFLFPGLEAVEAFQDSDAGKSLLDELADRGIQGLAFWHNGMKHMLGPVAMRKPEDAVGLRFRIQDSDVIQEEILQIGGIPQKMAFSEIYMALQTGAIDAQENTWSNSYAQKFYEVQPYMTQTNHGYAGYMVAVNSDFWIALPADIRTELDLIVAETAVWAKQRSNAINQESLEKILASGQSELVELSSEELAVWQTAMQPVWEKFEQDIGADLIQAALSASQ